MNIDELIEDLKQVKFSHGEPGKLLGNVTIRFERSTYTIESREPKGQHCKLCKDEASLLINSLCSRCWEERP